ncbi:hypothetical protein H0H87_008123 [Tephrocybe sp. NHM501043]|nr:hypothetical protein H0H87_008123 [Tephrocybe sp. NHM501043]
MYPQPWDPYYRRGYYPQPNPDVYLPPPPASAPVFGYRTGHSTPHGSNKHPQLFYLLAADSTRLEWDTRRPPSSIHPSTFYSNRNTVALQTAAKKLHIVSKAFPWAIEIDSQVAITCEMVWAAIYHALQEPIADSEWGLILNIKKHREVVEKAAKKRKEENKEDTQSLRRIDYLGESTMFKGLDKDEDFVKLRAPPVCGDVVKKPKLDQHRSRCHGGFDCIDCSTTFNTPAEYKGHTQCISEAEKYQKSLYKGPKTAAPAPRNNYPPQPPAPAPQFGSGRGGYGGRGRGRGGRGGWGQARSSATGANDTPLGTPTLHVVASPAPTPVKAPEPAPEPAKAAPSTSDEKKKDKKRKADDISDVTTSKKAKIAEEPSKEVTSAEKTKKKEKKEKGKKKENSEDIEMSGPGEETKSKKEKKKDVVENVEATISVELVTTKSKKEKKEKKKDVVEKVEATISVELVTAKSKKEKKEKKEKAKERKGEDVIEADPSTEKREKKDKKDKSEKKEKKERKRASSISAPRTPYPSTQISPSPLLSTAPRI